MDFTHGQWYLCHRNIKVIQLVVVCYTDEKEIIRCLLDCFQWVTETALKYSTQAKNVL